MPVFLSILFLLIASHFHESWLIPFLAFMSAFTVIPILILCVDLTLKNILKISKKKTLWEKYWYGR